MPTFKHPCPYCGKFIDRVVSACPFCGQVEPFSPKRCVNCRRIIEDAAWIVCPGCGASLIAPVATTPGTGTAAGGAAATPGSPAPGAAPAGPAAPQASASAQPQAPIVSAPPAGKCSGCGGPLPSGARFCTVCGTVAG